MSKSLFLPTAVLEEAELEGHTTASQALGSRGTMEFVNSSLSTIQTFFARMIQLDPDEDFIGNTGRDTNGFRLTTEDEPPGVDHDTFISLRSDHIAGIGIQCGKESISDPVFFMGTWDSTTGSWGAHGALRIDMSDSNAFAIQSNYGQIAFNNNATTRRLTADVYNLKVGVLSQHIEFQDLETTNPGLFFANNAGDAVDPDDAGATIYAKSGEIYRRKGDGTISAWATGGGSGGFVTSDDYAVSGTWGFSPSSGKSVPNFQPYSTGAPFTIGSNGYDQVVSRLNADLLDGNHASAFTIDTAGVGTTIVGNWTFNPTSGGDFPDLPSNTKFSQSTGTAPFQVSSTTVVTNLHSANSDELGGTAAADFATDAEVATLLTGYAKLSDNETVTGDYGFTGDVTFGGGGANGSFTIGAPAGSEAPISLTSPSATVVTGLNADYLDGYHSTSFGRLGSADTVSANWTFSGTPDFTNSTPFTVASGSGTVTNLRADSVGLAENSSALGGVAAAGYTRHANTETISAQWTFEDYPIRIKQISAPSEPVDTYAYLWYDSGDNGLWFRDHNTEGNHNVNLLSGNVASALYEDTGTSSDGTAVTLRTITPTTPDQTYFVEAYIVGRGTGGNFDNGFVAVKAYASFYTKTDSTFVRLPDFTTGGSPSHAYDGAGTSIGFGGASSKFTVDIIDDSDNIKVTIQGCASGDGAGDYSWKAWTKVYNY